MHRGFRCSGKGLALAIDWGLTTSIVGSLISTVGFVFTVQQLRRTAKATEAAKTAIGQLRNRMTAFDYASECVRAGKSLEHASRLLRLHQWQDASVTLLDTQLLLHRISQSKDGRPDARQSAGALATELIETIQDLEEAGEKDIEYEYRPLITNSRKHINVLDSELVVISRGLYDDA